MLSDFIQIVKKYKSEIILGIIVFLLIMLSFAVGYIAAKYQERQPIIFQDSVL